MNEIGFDWQFVIVTLAALCGGLVLLRPLWQLRGSKNSPKPTDACGRCSSPGCTVRADRGPETGLVRLGSGKPGAGA